MSDGLDTTPLDQLAEAQTPAELAKAHGRLRSVVTSTRKKAAQQWGKLATAYEEAMRYWEAMKADGASFPKRCHALEQVLRDHWPQSREQPWRYLCERCEDSGLMIAECAGDATCGRPKTHGPHPFGTPCWCALGAKFRDKPKPTPEDFTQAGKSSRKMTRLGSR